MSNSDKNRIAMIIDDDEIDQFFHQKTINETGAFDKVITFEYATHALDYIREREEFPVDVIFLDINLPRMNGFEFLNAAESEFGDNFAKVVVAMVTSSMAQQDMENAKKYRAVKRYINKPLTVDAIKEVAMLLEP